MTQSENMDIEKEVLHVTQTTSDDGHLSAV